MVNSCFLAELSIKRQKFKSPNLATIGFMPLSAPSD